MNWCSTEWRTRNSLQQPVWPYWTIYCTLGNFSKSVATINFAQNCPHFYAIYVIFHFSSESFLANCYRNLAPLTGHTDNNPLGLGCSLLLFNFFVCSTFWTGRFFCWKIFLSFPRKNNGFNSVDTIAIASITKLIDIQKLVPFTNLEKFLKSPSHHRTSLWSGLIESKWWCWGGLLGERNGAWGVE